MKKICLAATILTLLFLLTACQGALTPLPYDSEALNPNSGILMQTVYPVYGADCEELCITIENLSEDTAEFGSQWYLERLSGKHWKRVQPDIHIGFNDILYILTPNAKRYDRCYLRSYQKHLKDGRYRILKEINGAWYTAEFEIGDSPITALTPHGFTPLEELPADYSPEQAAADGAVVLRQGEILHGERMSAILRDRNCYGFVGQLRVMSESGDGWLLTDLIWENERITRITKTLGAGKSDSVITQHYGFMHLHNGTLYLSNRRDFTTADGCTPLFGGLPLPQEITDSLSFVYDSEFTVPLKAWSPDGLLCASVGYEGSLFINCPPRWGTICGGKHSGLPIVDLIWQDAGTLMVMAESGEPGIYLYEFIHIDAEDMKSIRTISYTYSAHSYITDEEGRILIPE